METSVFFVKFWGYFLFLFGAALFFSKEGRVVMIRLSKEESFVVLTGMFSIAIGLPVILLHNIWTADVLGFVTFLGWMSVLKGVIRIAKPSVVIDNFKEGKGILLAAMIVGLGLMYAGYYPYWC
jgi:hypothetical protein